MRFILIAVTLVLAALPARAETLTVYTYDSFAAEWGPAPKLKQLFEADCDCTVDFVGLEDAVAILSRIRFEGDATKADIALGLDTGLVADARATGLFAPHPGLADGLAGRPIVPGGFTDDIFIPYDYGYFAFIYDTTKLANPPASLEALVENGGTISLLIQDPRTSSPGLGLVLWMRKVFGDRTSDAWAKLEPRIVTVTQGWSEAYGLFQKGEADMVLSYTTSPAYHMTVEDETKYQAAAFTEGHYMQIEVAAKLARSPHQALADRFLAFLVSEEAQAVIPSTQWMYPVRDVGEAVPSSFDKLVEVKTPLTFTPEEVSASRSAWVAEWREALSR